MRRLLNRTQVFLLFYAALPFAGGSFVLVVALQARRYEDHFERDGLAMTFVSMHRPLNGAPRT